MSDRHALLLALARSGQLSAKQWADHLRDEPGLAAFVAEAEAAERKDAERRRPDQRLWIIDN